MSKKHDTGVVVHKEKVNGLRRARVLLVAGLLVVALAGAGYMVYRSRVNDEKPKPTSQYEQDKAAAEKYFDTKYSKALDDAEAKLKASKTPEEKAAAYLAMSNAASAGGDADAAADYAAKAVETKQTIDGLIAAAFQAEKLNDYKRAAEYYGKAADLAKQSGGANAQSEYLNYKSMQETAEKKQ